MPGEFILPRQMKFSGHKKCPRHFFDKLSRVEALLILPLCRFAFSFDTVRDKVLHF